MAGELDVNMESSDETKELQEKESALQAAVNDGASFVERCRGAYDFRNCVWDGQSDDARKHRKDLNAEPFPWEGASDVKIRLVDEVVNDNKRILQASLMRAQLQATAMESGDAPQAAATTTLLKWAVYTKCAEFFRKEVSLLANWQELYGVDMLAVTWEQELRLRWQPITLEVITAMETQLLQQQGESPAQASDLRAAIFDEDREDEVIEWMQGVWPAFTRPKARTAVRELREEGQTKVPLSFLAKNQPRWTALQCFRDVFFPANTTDLQSAPWVAIRETVTEVELRKRVISDEYEESAVEKVIKTCKGKSVLDDLRVEGRWRGSKTSTIDDMKDLFEVISFYEKEVDDEGYTSIKVCVFVPGSGVELKSYDQGYDHEEYPVVEFVRDWTERALIDNKGVADVIDTEQGQIKTHRDFRTDRASIAINPPVRVPIGRATRDLLFGPGSKIPERRPGEHQWMEPPRFDPDTINLEEQVRISVNNYFGRIIQGVDPNRQMFYTQHMTENWLAGWRKVARQTLALCTQYLSPEEIMRITGVAMPPPNDIEKLKEYDLQMEFNAANLNAEAVLKKLDVINKAILPADTMGVIDRAGLIQWAMRSVDPSLAQGVVRDQSAAANQEIEDETVQFAKLSSGVEPEMKKGGQNYALRLNVLDQIVAMNPNIQQRYAMDQIFKAMIDNRKKHFEFQLQQQKNAQIGRIGTAPTLQAPQGPAGGPAAPAAGAAY